MRRVAALARASTMVAFRYDWLLISVRRIVCLQPRREKELVQGVDLFLREVLNKKFQTVTRMVPCLRLPRTVSLISWRNKLCYPLAAISMGPFFFSFSFFSFYVHFFSPYLSHTPWFAREKEKNVTTVTVIVENIQRQVRSSFSTLSLSLSSDWRGPIVNVYRCVSMSSNWRSVQLM